MTDTMASFLPVALFFQHITGQFPERADGLLSHRYACYNTYETSDGKYLSIGAVENRFWKVLCEKLGVPEYIPLQYDEKRRQEILDFIRNSFGQKTLSEWEDILGEHDICWAPVKSVSEAIQDPQMRSREMFVEIDDGNGNKTTTIGIPIKLSNTPGSIRRIPDSFGQSTKSILKEFGYSDEKIKVFAEKGVI
jgi:crotonobetainyl-CoA:carnitine CoA-transferase CaiB-like acyl-CoA transferase